MGKGSGFALVQRHRLHFGLQRSADVHEHVGTESWLELPESPLGRGWHFEGINLPDRAVSRRPGRRQHGPMHHHVVNVQVAAVMGVDDLRPKVLNIDQLSRLSLCAPA